MDGCEILHHQKDCFPHVESRTNGINHQLVPTKTSHTEPRICPGGVRIWCPRQGTIQIPEDVLKKYGSWTEKSLQVQYDLMDFNGIPSGKHTKSYGKSLFSMGKSTISIAMFNSFLYVYQRGYVHDFSWDISGQDTMGYRWILHESSIT